MDKTVGTLHLLTEYHHNFHRNNAKQRGKYEQKVNKLDSNIALELLDYIISNYLIKEAWKRRKLCFLFKVFAKPLMLSNDVCNW